MKHHLLMIAVLLILLAAGCSSPDERLARLAEATSTQQARQNEAVTELNLEAGENHRRVVEAVEHSRQEIVLLERDLQHQRNAIDDERRSLANERHRESLLGPVLSSLGMLVVAALSLVLCWWLLVGLKTEKENAEDTVSELLIHELADDQPLLLSQPRREHIEQSDARGQREDQPPPF